jgi:hypothetical protein
MFSSAFAFYLDPAGKKVHRSAENEDRAEKHGQAHVYTHIGGKVGAQQACRPTGLWQVDESTTGIIAQIPSQY